MSGNAPFAEELLEPGIRSRLVETAVGLRMHILEAGYEGTSRPCVLLLHGFPELAFSWRKVLLPLAAAGYHVVAPDQRGYGRTTGWRADYDGDLQPYRLFNLAADALALIHALGRRSVRAVVGHDFGSPVAACCALARPDVFRSLVLMSAPFAGTPPAAGESDVGGIGSSPPMPSGRTIHEELAALEPPRKHYQWYYSTRPADADMRNCPQGLHAFLRAYYHMKSADWSGKHPHPLTAWSATELAKLPTYYVMELHRTMAETVAAEMPSQQAIDACRWLPDRELAVYAGEFGRTGFQGGLQWYRCGTTGLNGADLALYAGRKIDVPAMFLAGRSDWGPYQRAGDLERMQDGAFSRFLGSHFVPGAGHWVQQEQPDAVSGLILEFLADPGSLEARP